MSNAKKGIVVALGLLFAGAAAAESVRTERQARAMIEAAGYDAVTAVELEGGVWQAVASDELGRDVEVRVDPVSGRVYSIARETIITTVGPLDAADVRLTLNDRGFRGVHDVRFDDDDNLWIAEAVDPAGVDVQIEVDASSGAIVHIEED
jgi:hypothetical protein